MSNPNDNHGHSVAAWTGVIICLIGSIISAVGVAIDKSIIMWAGLAVFAAGGIIGWVMGRAKRGSATAKKGAHQAA